MATPSDDPAAFDPLSDIVRVETADGGVISLTRAEYEARQAGGEDTGRRVTLGETAAGLERDVESQVYGDVGDIALTGLESFASGATLGGSDLLAKALLGDEWAAERLIRQRVNPGTAVAGEVAGGVAPTLLTGGSSAVGTAGRLLRYTPVALVERQGARAAAMGVSRGGKLAGKAAGYAVEGAADSAGQYIAQESLKGNELSAAGVAASIGTGALISAGTGLGTLGIGKGLAKAGELGEAAAARMVDAPKGKGSKKVGNLADQKVAEAVEEMTGGSGRVPLSDMITAAPTSQSSRKEALSVIQRIDDADTRLYELEDALQRRGAIDDPELQQRLTDALEVRREAQAQARQWGEGFANDVQSLVNQPRNKTVKATIRDEIDHRGVRVLGALDDADAMLTDVISQVEARTGMPVARLTGEPILQPEVKAQSAGFFDRAAGIGDKVTDLAGAVEVAQSLGMPVPDLDSVPVVGPILSAYAKARFLLGKVSGQSTRATNVAEKAAAAAATARKVRQVGEALAGNGKLPSAIRRAGADTIRSIGERIASTTPEQDEAAIEKATRDLPPEVAGPAADAARRKAAYLREHMPGPTASDQMFGREWRPTPEEARRGALIQQALDDPGGAVAEQMRSNGFSSVTKDAIRQVYPDLWASLQADVASRAPEIYRREPLSRAVAIGRWFDVPTAPQLWPDVQQGLLQQSMGAAAPQQPEPSRINLGAPSAVSQTAMAQERTLGRSLP